MCLRSADGVSLGESSGAQNTIDSLHELAPLERRRRGKDGAGQDAMNIALEGACHDTVAGSRNNICHQVILERPKIGKNM